MPKSLHAVIGDTKAKSLSKHGEFPPGVPPKIFTQTEGCTFVISDPILAAAVEAAQAIGSIEVYWVVRHGAAPNTLEGSSHAFCQVTARRRTPWRSLLDV